MTGLLKETLRQIPVPSSTAEETLRQQLKRQIPDFPQLGRLQELALKYTAARQEISEVPPKKCTIIFCGDHGVARQGVSAYPQETTMQMVRNYLIARGAAANAFSDFAAADLLVVDAGIAGDLRTLPGLLTRKIAFGTEDFTKGPAMTQDQAIKSLETGIEIAKTCCANGYTCFLPGEMGIANTTASAAMAAVFCHLSAQEATGRGTNISDQRLQKKRQVVQQALTCNHPNPMDGIDILQKIGGFEFGCMAGLILGAAAHHGFVLLDGFNTGVAALIAQSLCPYISQYLFATQCSSEPAHAAVLQRLQLNPCMDLKLRLSETAASSLAAGWLDILSAAIKNGQEANAAPPGTDSAFFLESMKETPAGCDQELFEFYTQTIPSLSVPSAQLCQKRLDHLSKPINSLGKLETLAKQMAGILADERPFHPYSSLLCFTAEDPLPQSIQHQLLAAATICGHQTTLAHITSCEKASAAFDFGRQTAESLSFASPVLGITYALPASWDRERLLHQLCTPKGNLRYPPTAFLNPFTSAERNLFAAFLGAIIAAAHNRTLVVLDDSLTEIIGAYAKCLCPDIHPYLLSVQPQLFPLGISCSHGWIAALGIQAVQASLHMLNQMKTFEECQVSTAADGPGATKQKQ